MGWQKMSKADGDTCCPGQAGGLGGETARELWSQEGPDAPLPTELTGLCLLEKMLWET